MAVFRAFQADGSWDNIDAPAGCVAELAELLKTEGVVTVDRLITRKTGVAERTVVRRIGLIITARSYVSIEDVTVRFIEEPEPEAAA